MIVTGNRWDRLAASTGPPPAVGVVVCHYDQPDALARTVAALHRQTLRPASITVADDGSSAAPDPAAPAGAVPVRVVHQADRGFRAAAARNLGAAHADGDVLVFLDADTTPEPGFVAALTRRIAACPDVLAVGRRRHADLSALRPGQDPSDAPRLPEPAWLSDGYRRSRNLLDADGRSFRYVISAVLALHRTLFDDIGGFDERYVGYGGEDWDLGYRAWNRGALLVHEPDAVAWHDGPDWAGRAEEGKDGEAIRLAALVPEPGTRGAPLPGAVPDVLVDVDPGLTGARLMDVVHALLRQTHRDLRVRLPGGDGRIAELYRGVADDRPWTVDQLRRARARLSVRAPLPPDAVERGVTLLTRHDLGRVEIHAADGSPAGTLSSPRADGRAHRAGVPIATVQHAAGVATLVSDGPRAGDRVVARRGRPHDR